MLHDSKFLENDHLGQVSSLVQIAIGSNFREGRLKRSTEEKTQKTKSLTYGLENHTTLFSLSLQMLEDHSVLILRFLKWNLRLMQNNATSLPLHLSLVFYFLRSGLCD